MKERKRRNRSWMFYSVILAGVINFAIGLYYSMVRAGIPVQNPTEKMQLEYVINMGIGETLIRNGLMLVLFGVTLRLLYEVIVLRRRNKEEP